MEIENATPADAGRGREIVSISHSVILNLNMSLSIVQLKISLLLQLRSILFYRIVQEMSIHRFALSGKIPAVIPQRNHPPEDDNWQNSRSRAHESLQGNT